MRERLQKIISVSGICSRRKAEQLISDGRVTVNGLPAVLGSSADAERDFILVDGKPLPRPGDHVYIMLNKPRGYVTTLSDEKGRPNVSQLVSDCGRRVYPVGRLDMDSQGLLLLTDDGDFANAMMHPRGEVDKIYRVTVSGYSEIGLQELRQPVVLDGYKIREPKVVLLSEGVSGKALLEITIHEGRNRQIRRMCGMAGMRVTKLVRIREDCIDLGDLPEGKWRFLTKQELQTLKRHF